jgi:hypothetical protein
MTSSREWIDAFAQRLGVEAPSEQEVTAILALAAVAAHASERTAAPVACWLAAREALVPEQALELAHTILPESTS